MTTRPDALADHLMETWETQGREGFLLADPAAAEIPTREVADEVSGVRFRFRWMPHREIRGEVAELERRGILNPDRDEAALFRDPRDPKGRHCFLCRANIEQCHPLERLVPMKLAGRDYYAGANFAWIEPHHFTVMSAEHVDQAYSRHALEAVCDLHRQTEGRFRVLLNDQGAGASIPWHLHYQITTAPMPVEAFRPCDGCEYPTDVRRFALDRSGALDGVHAFADAWLLRDPEHHGVNLLVAGPPDDPAVFIFPRDRRRATAEEKGLVGGFEVSGDFCLSAPAEEQIFNEATAETARSILGQVKPSALDSA